MGGDVREEEDSQGGNSETEGEQVCHDYPDCLLDFMLPMRPDR